MSERTKLKSFFLIQKHEIAHAEKHKKDTCEVLLMNTETTLLKTFQAYLIYHQLKSFFGNLLTTKY